MFKQSQIYGWEAEPVDERPSEFMPSTGYSSLSSGDHTLDRARRGRRRRSRFGFRSLIAFCVSLMGIGVYALLKLAPLLHR